MTSNDLPPVWPWPEGNTRGVGLEPLYRKVPPAALRDLELYELLPLVDAIRDGRARERQIAEQDLVRRLRMTQADPSLALLVDAAKLLQTDSGVS